MNINPYGRTLPHYDSYDDFYKYFEVSPQQTEEDSRSIDVFPSSDMEKLRQKEEAIRQLRKQSRQRKLFA